jgi:hypothetical protein
LIADGIRKDMGAFLVSVIVGGSGSRRRLTSISVLRTSTMTIRAMPLCSESCSSSTEIEGGVLVGVGRDSYHGTDVVITEY